MGQSSPHVSKRIIRMVLAGLLAGILMSAALWGNGDRTFPCLPLWGEATDPSGIWHSILFGMLVAIVAGGIFRPAQVWTFPLVVLLPILCLLDLNRLQPWVWLYFLAISLTLLKKETAHVALRWLLAAVYVWGGLNKMTPYFAEDNFAWFCEAFETTKFLSAYPVAGYAVALFETGLGVVLLWPGEHRRSRWMFVVFHVLIMLVLLKSEWNYVVLPWNATMAALAFTALSQPFSWKYPLPIAQKAVLLLAWLPPAAGLFQMWPYQLSWQMYTNLQPEATFYSAMPCEKTGAVWAEKSYDNGRRLLLDDWAFASIRTPMFYSDRTFTQVGRYLCRCVPASDSSGLFILRVHPWNKNAEQSEDIPCEALQR